MEVPMRIDPERHLAQPLLIHRLTRDFQLLDVWRVPTRASSFEAFVRSFPLLRRDGASALSKPALFLFALRELLMRVIGKRDVNYQGLPIPGCRETSVRERLSAEERAEFALPSRGESMFVPVYATPNERAHEISNATVHAVLHLCWVVTPEGPEARMAVYAKTRGWLGRAYMGLIEPFRRFVVYPALLRAAARA
jgi:hypothetical protein